ncbi:MAG: SDR family NAD(P)-dependent oxidoreductase, partial [Polyangia bacterium]
DDWRWIFDVNVWAGVYLARAFLPAMVARGKGYIVFTASLAGLVGAPGMVAYSTSKFALVGFAESLRHELRDAGVDVTLVCPGYVKTNLHRATRYGNVGFQRLLDAPPAWYGLSSARAARRIVDGLARRRPLVVLGPEKLGWWLKRLWPSAGLAVTRWVAGRHGILPPPEAPCTSP